MSFILVEELKYLDKTTNIVWELKQQPKIT